MVKNIVFKCKRGHPLSYDGYGLSCTKALCLEDSYIDIPGGILKICKQCAEQEVENALDKFKKQLRDYLGCNS